jgi:superoxide dismutase
VLIDKQAILPIFPYSELIYHHNSHSTATKHNATKTTSQQHDSTEKNTKEKRASLPSIRRVAVLKSAQSVFYRKSKSVGMPL